jgi:hypothetical protein
MAGRISDVRRIAEFMFSIYFPNVTDPASICCNNCTDFVSGECQGKGHGLDGTVECLTDKIIYCDQVPMEQESVRERTALLM